VKKELYKILENLATHGIGEPGLLEGYSECKEGFIENFRIVDVRTLVDGENPLFEYELNIIRVVSYLELGEKVVICCSAGISRSNAIALGVLMHYFKNDVNQALELITSKVPICNILPTHISTLHKLLNVKCKLEA
jgi:protein-tyrosine phosphatase